MSTNKKAFPNALYQSNTHKVTSRHPLVINKANYTAVKNEKYSNLKLDMNKTLENLYHFKYIFIDECPDSNICHYDSNLKKYRTISSSVEKSLNSKAFNLNQQNDSLAKNNRYSSQTKTNIQNKYLINKSTNSSMNKTQIINRETNYLKNDKNDKNQTSIKLSKSVHGDNNQYSKNQISSRNENINISNKIENKRMNSYSNRNETKTGNIQVNIGSKVQAKSITNNTKINLIPTSRPNLNIQTNQSTQLKQGMYTGGKNDNKIILTQATQAQQDKGRGKVDINAGRVNTYTSSEKYKINTNINKAITSTNMNKPNTSNNINKAITGTTLNKININNNMNKAYTSNNMNANANKANVSTYQNKTNTSTNLNKTNATTYQNKQFK